jgi:hypothetical protein
MAAMVAGVGPEKLRANRVYRVAALSADSIVTVAPNIVKTVAIKFILLHFSQ